MDTEGRRTRGQPRGDHADKGPPQGMTPREAQQGQHDDDNPPPIGEPLSRWYQFSSRVKGMAEIRRFGEDHRRRLSAIAPE